MRSDSDIERDVENELRWGGQKLVLPGASKDALSKLPEFHYA
jgi:hypothetical protein